MGSESQLADQEPCGVCGSTGDSHDNRMHRAFYLGRDMERVEIAEWLRSVEGHMAIAEEIDKSDKPFTPHSGVTIAAAAIERGQHHE